MKGIRRGIWSIMAAVLSLALLSGCKKELASVSEITEIKAYTLPQTMIVVTAERNQYQQIYTSQIWGVTLPDGKTFEDYLLGQVKEFLEEMKMMNLLAQKEEITITSVEKEELRKLSEEYFESLTQEDLDYLAIEEEDARTMYEEYYLANKVVTELTKDMNLEISDSEAKVIVVEQIVLSDIAVAEEVLLRVLAEGADFEAIAREYSEDPMTTCQIGRGEQPGAREEAAFSLALGEVSQVVEENNRYYIMKCVSDYDEDATQERKAGLYQKRKKEAFDQIYRQFKEENPVVFKDDIWKDIKFSKEDKTSTTEFFELYRKYFPDK